MRLQISNDQLSTCVEYREFMGRLAKKVVWSYVEFMDNYSRGMQLHVGFP